MKLRVVTPQGPILEEAIVSVALWTALGEIEVLRGHTPFIVLLEPGEMRVRNGAGIERFFAAGEGFARIDCESVTIFSDMAEDTAGIGLDEAAEAKSRAEAAIAEAASLSEEEREAADLALRESLVRIQITVRRRGGNMQRGPAPRE